MAPPAARAGRGRSRSATGGLSRLFLHLPLLLVVFLACACVPPTHAAPPPLSAPLTALLNEAGVYLNFSRAHPLHQAEWLPAPSGLATAGLLSFDSQVHALDVGDQSMFFPGQPTLPTPMWYLPIRSSCDYYAVVQPGECSDPALFDTPGWSLAVWVNIQQMDGSAHLFSALQGGFTLRFSVNGDATLGGLQQLQLVSTNYAYDAPLVCTGNSTVPLYTWNLLSLTQWNTSEDLSASRTVFYINGVPEPLACTSQPYWDSPRNAKTNIYVGMDPLSPDDVLHAKLAMWAFWYRPLNDTEHQRLGDENPSAIAGPLPMLIFPALEAGRPMLDYTPREFLLQPQTSLRGTSTFTLCLNSDVVGAVLAPACQSWRSGEPVGRLTFAIVNPSSNTNTNGNVRFWWTSTFTGTGLPGATTEAYWLSLFVLPPEMNFARIIPYSQLTSTAQTWTTRFATTPSPLPTTWQWVPGPTTATGGYAFINMGGDYKNRIDLMLSADRTAVGSTPALPPTVFGGGRQLGFAWSMWLNVSTDVTPWAEITLFRGIMDWPANPWTNGEGGVLFQVGLKNNHSFVLRYDSCVYNSGTQPNLKPWQWNQLGIQFTQLGQLSIFWNGRKAYGPVQCGQALVDYAKVAPQWRVLRIGPNITGIRLEADGDFWPLRMELGGVSFFSRTLLPEEWYLSAMSPPAAIGAQALPFNQLTLPPLSLALGATFTWALYPPSWFGGDVTMYVSASNAGGFASGTEVRGEVTNVAPAVRKMVWTKPAPSTAGASGAIRWVDIKMPVASGCVHYKSWLVGDTARFRTVDLAEFDICVSTLAFLQSHVVAQVDLSAPPSPATRFIYVPMSTSPPTGLAQLRFGTSDKIDFRRPDDRVVGTPASIAPTDSTGYTVLLHLMHAREQCHEIVFYIEHMRFRIHCTGLLHIEWYAMGYYTTSGSTGFASYSPSSLYVPIMQFMWIGTSYDPARQTVELFRYGGGYEQRSETFAEVRIPAPPELVARSTGIGWGSSSNPTVQVSTALWFEHRLTYEEMRLIATSLTPPVFTYGKFPFHYSDAPRTCPPNGGSFDFVVYLPHTYGSTVTVTMTSARGTFTPASVTWATQTTPEGQREVGRTFTCVCAATGVTQFDLKLTGDTTRYFLPTTSFQVTQVHPADLASFRLKTSAITAPTTATKEVAYNTILFDGWSQYLNLNLAKDTGVTPTGTPAVNIPPQLLFAPEDDWLPERTGFSFEGWYQPLSWNHAHTLFSNGPTEASYNQLSMSTVVISMTNMADYGYGLVYEANYNVPYYSWSTGYYCLARANVQFELGQWVHWAVVFQFSRNSVQLYVDGKPFGSASTCNPPINPSATTYPNGRTYAYAGMDQPKQRFARGRVSSLNAYDWPLTLNELSLVSALGKPSKAPFALNDNFVPKLEPGLPQPLTIYPPFRAGVPAVTLRLTASSAGVLPTNPLDVTWPAVAVGVRVPPQTVTVTMPAGMTSATITFSVVGGGGLFVAPSTLTLGVTNQAVIIAEAASSILFSTSTSTPAHAGWKANAIVGRPGAAYLKPLPAPATPGVEAKQYLTFGDASDRSTGTVDPWFLYKGMGWTFTGWFMLDDTAASFDHYLFSAWRTAADEAAFGRTAGVPQPDQAYYLRTNNKCFQWRFPLLRHWTSTDSAVQDYGFYDFGCGSWRANEFLHIAISYRGNDNTAVFYINGQEVGRNRAWGGMFGEWDNVRIGAPPYVDPDTTVYNNGICWFSRYINGGLAAINTCRVTRDWEWPDSNSAMQGRVFEGRFWTRALAEFEIRSAFAKPPTNIGPVAFKVLSSSFKAIGWGRSDTFGIAVPLQWNTHPTLTPRLTSPNTDYVDYVVVTPPIDTAYDLSEYLWTVNTPYYRTFTIQAKQFVNAPENYIAPTVRFRFLHTGDTSNFLPPPDIVFGPEVLLETAVFDLLPYGDMLHAGLEAGVRPGTGFAAFVWESGSFTLPYLNLGLDRDTAGAGLFPLQASSSAGMAGMAWVNINFPKANVPATILWTGTPYKPASTDVLFEVGAPQHRLRLRFWISSFIALPVVDCKAAVDFPLDRWMHVGFTISPTGETKLYMSGHLVSTCGFVKGGGGPKGPGTIQRTAAWTGRSPNFAGQLSGAIARLSVFNRELTVGEIAALSASPPYSIGPRKVDVTLSDSLSATSLTAATTAGLTPFLETCLGLQIVPAVTSPVWYQTVLDYFQLQLEIWSAAAGSSPLADMLDFATLQPTAQNTHYLTVTWTVLVPYLTVTLASSDVAHYSTVPSFRITNTLPYSLLATATFQLNTAAKSQSAGWGVAPIARQALTETDQGIVQFNSSVSLESLNLLSPLDTLNSLTLPPPQPPALPTMPSKLSASGFSVLLWVRLTTPTPQQLANITQLQLFSWRSSVDPLDAGIALTVDYPTRRLTFSGSVSSAPGSRCSCSTARPFVFDMFAPVLLTWTTGGMMRVAVGDAGALYYTDECECSTPEGVYPDATVTRAECRVGRIAVGNATGGRAAAPMVELAQFAYFASPWDATQAQILAFAAPRNVAPAGWHRTPAVLPSTSFLNVPLLVTLEPSVWSTLNGNVTLRPVLEGGGSVEPASVLFSTASSGARTFRFTTPFRDALWNVSWQIEGDDFFIVLPESFSIDCKIGLVSARTVPANMLPTQAVTIQYQPQAYIATDLGLRFFVNGAQAQTSSTGAQFSVSSSEFTWPAESVAVRSLTLRSAANYGTASWFNFSTAVFGSDAYNFRAPLWRNISISSTARVLIDHVPTQLYANSRTSPPIELWPDTIPELGVTLTIVCSKGDAFLSQTTATFPPGVITTVPFDLLTTFTFPPPSTTVTVSFLIKPGGDSAYYIPPPPFTVTVFTPAPMVCEAPATLPAGVYGRQTTLFTYYPSVTPSPTVNMTVRVEGAALYAALGDPLTNNITLGWTEAIQYGQKPLSFTVLAPTVSADSSFRLRFEMSGPDAEHFIPPADVVVAVYPQSTLEFVSVTPPAILPSDVLNGTVAGRVRCNDTFTIRVRASRAPRGTGSDVLVLLADAGTVTPASRTLTAANYNTLQEFTWKAPPFIYDSLRLRLAVTGAYADYYVAPKPIVLMVRGYFLRTSVPLTALYIGQVAPPQTMVAVGAPAGSVPAVQLAPSSTGQSAIFTPAVIEFDSSLVGPRTWYYSAPFAEAAGVNTATVSFSIVGGVDAALMDPPSSFTYQLLRFDLNKFVMRCVSDSALLPAADHLILVSPPPFGQHYIFVTYDVPYAYNRMEVLAGVTTPGSVKIKGPLTGARPLADAVWASTPLGLLPASGTWIDLAVGQFHSMLVNATVDGNVYLLWVRRLPPDLSTVDVFPTYAAPATDVNGRPGRIWSIAPLTVSVNGSSSPTSYRWLAEQRVATFSLPYSTSAISFSLQGSTDFLASLVYNPSLVLTPLTNLSSPSFSPAALFVALTNSSSSLSIPMGNGAAAEFYALRAGVEEVFLLNSTADGLYAFRITRMLPPIPQLDVSVAHIAEQVGFAKQCTTCKAVLTPAWSPSVLSYTATSTSFLLGAVTVQTVLTVPAVSAQAAPGNTAANITQETNGAWRITLAPDVSNTLTITTPLDGAYTIRMLRQAAHVTSIAVTAYDQLLLPSAQPLSPAFSRGSPSYLVTVPYGTESASVSYTVDPTRTATVTVTGGGAPVRLVQYANNTLFVNDTLDGAVALTLRYAQPNMQQVCAAAQGVFLVTEGGCTQGGVLGNYAGASPSDGGATAGQAALSFRHPQRAYSLIVPFVMDTVAFRVDLGVDEPVTLLSQGKADAPQSVTKGAPSVSLKLDVGTNQIALNSSLDGYYQFQITRADTDLTALVLSSVSATAGWSALLPPSVLEPPFTRRVLNYSVSVPAVVGSVRVTATFATNNSLTQRGNVLGTLSPLVSLEAGAPLPLLCGATNVQTLLSTQDGVYTLTITRAVFDTRGVVLTLFDAFGRATVEPLLGAWVDGLYEYHAEVNYGAMTATVKPILTSGNGAYLSIENAGAPTPLVPAPAVLSHISFNHTLDGAFRIALNRRAPDIAGVVFQLPDTGEALIQSASVSSPVLPQLAYVGVAGSPAAGSASALWVAEVHEYTITLPYRRALVNVTVAFATAGTVSFARVDRRPLSGAAVLAEPSAQVPLQAQLLVGANVFELNSTLDGYYRVTLIRLPPDLTAVALLPLTDSPGWTDLPAVVLAPPFPVPGVLSYATSVPFSVAQVQLAFTFSTPNSSVLVLDDGGQSQWLLQGSAALQSGVSVTVRLPPGAPLCVTVVSVMDANWTFTFTRSVPDLTGLRVTSFDEHGASAEVALDGGFVSGQYGYVLRPPYGTEWMDVEVTRSDSSSALRISHNGTALPLNRTALFAPNVYELTDYVDGRYELVALRRQPDIHGVLYQLFDGAVLMHSDAVEAPLQPAYPYAGWAGAAGTADEAVAYWSGVGRRHTQRVAFKYDHLLARLHFDTPDSISLERVDLGGNADPEAPPVRPGNGTLVRMPLRVGGNRIRINSTALDGYYESWLERLPNDLSNVTLVSQSAALGWHLLPAAPLQPLFTSPVRRYNVTVPFLVTYVQLVATFATPNSTSLRVPSTGLTCSLLSLQASAAWVPLAAGATTTVVLSSELDGVYELSIWRDLSPALFSLANLTLSSALDSWLPFGPRWDPLYDRAYTVSPPPHAHQVNYSVQLLTAVESGAEAAVDVEVRVNGVVFARVPAASVGQLVRLDDLPLRVAESNVIDFVPLPPQEEGGHSRARPYWNYTLVVVTPTPLPCLAQPCEPGFACVNGATAADDWTRYLCIAHMEAPTAVVHAPGSVNNCTAPLNLDGSASFGLGPPQLHPFRFQWRVVSLLMQDPSPFAGAELIDRTAANFSRDAQRELLTNTSFGMAPAGNSSLMPVTDSLVRLPFEELLVHARYTFELVAANLMLASAPVRAIVSTEPVAADAPWLPALGIVAPPVVWRATATLFRAAFTQSSCASIPRGTSLEYAWIVRVLERMADAPAYTPALADLPDALTELRSTQAQLLIAPLWLVVGVRYSVTLRVTFTAPAAAAGGVQRRLLSTASATVTAQASAQIFIEPMTSPLLARIVGAPGMRTRPADDSIVVDASTSFDPANEADPLVTGQPSARVAFAWHVTERTTGAAVLALGGASTSQPVLRLPAHALPEDQRYIVLVNVSSLQTGDARSATQSVELLTSAASSLRVSVPSAPQRMASHEALQLLALVQHKPLWSQAQIAANIRFAWTVQLAPQQYIAENEPALADWIAPDLSDPLVVASQPATASLLLRPNVLPLPGTYAFTVLAWDASPDNSTALRNSTATVVIEVLRPPEGGQCWLVPAETVEYSSVTVQCDGWFQFDASSMLLYGAELLPALAPAVLDGGSGGTAAGAPPVVVPGSSSLVFSLPTPSPHFPVRLGDAGWYVVRVRVSNDYGAVTTVDLLAHTTVAPARPADGTALVRYLQSIADDQLQIAIALRDDSTALQLLLDLGASLDAVLASHPGVASHALTRTLVSTLVVGLERLVRAELETVWADGDVSTSSGVTSVQLAASLAFGQMGTQVLSLITPHVALFDADTWSLANFSVSGVLAQRRGVLLASVQLPVPGVPWTLPSPAAAALAASVADLMNNCTRFDAESAALSSLLTVAQCNQPVGSVVHLPTPAWTATSTRNYLYLGPATSNSTAISNIWGQYGAQINNASTTVNIDSWRDGWALVDTRVTVWSARWAACRGADQLRSVTVNAPNGTTINPVGDGAGGGGPSGGQHLSFPLPLDANTSASIFSRALAIACDPELVTSEQAIGDYVTCNYWNNTLQQLSSVGCSIELVQAPLPAPGQQQEAALVMCRCSHGGDMTLLVHEPAAPVCEPDVGPAEAYVLYAALYALLALTSAAAAARGIMQRKSATSARAAAATGTWLAVNEYTCLSVLCVLRALQALATGEVPGWFDSVPQPDRAAVTALPQLLLPWVLGCAVVWQSRWRDWLRAVHALLGGKSSSGGSSTTTSGSSGGHKPKATGRAYAVHPQLVEHSESSAGKRKPDLHPTEVQTELSGNLFLKTPGGAAAAAAAAAATTAAAGGCGKQQAARMDVPAPGTMSQYTRRWQLGYALSSVVAILLLALSGSASSGGHTQALLQRAVWLFAAVLHALLFCMTLWHAWLMWDAPPLLLTGKQQLQQVAVVSAPAAAVAPLRSYAHTVWERVRWLCTLIGGLTLAACALAVAVAWRGPMRSPSFLLYSGYFLCDCMALAAVGALWWRVRASEAFRREIVLQLEAALRRQMELQQEADRRANAARADSAEDSSLSSSGSSRTSRSRSLLTEQDDSADVVAESSAEGTAAATVTGEGALAPLPGAVLADSGAEVGAASLRQHGWWVDQVFNKNVQSQPGGVPIDLPGRAPARLKFQGSVVKAVKAERRFQPPTTVAAAAIAELREHIHHLGDEKEEEAGGGGKDSSREEGGGGGGEAGGDRVSSAAEGTGAETAARAAASGDPTVQATRADIDASSPSLRHMSLLFLPTPGNPPVSAAAAIDAAAAGGLTGAPAAVAPDALDTSSSHPEQIALQPAAAELQGPALQETHAPVAEGGAAAPGSPSVCTPTQSVPLKLNPLKLGALGKRTRLPLVIPCSPPSRPMAEVAVLSSARAAPSSPAAGTVLSRPLPPLRLISSPTSGPAAVSPTLSYAPSSVSVSAATATAAAASSLPTQLLLLSPENDDSDSLEPPLCLPGDIAPTANTALGTAQGAADANADADAAGWAVGGAIADGARMDASVRSVTVNQKSAQPLSDERGRVQMRKASVDLLLGPQSLPCTREIVDAEVVGSLFGASPPDAADASAPALAPEPLAAAVGAASSTPRQANRRDTCGSPSLSTMVLRSPLGSPLASPSFRSLSLSGGTAFPMTAGRVGRAFALPAAVTAATAAAAPPAAGDDDDDDDDDDAPQSSPFGARSPSIIGISAGRRQPSLMQLREASSLEHRNSSSGGSSRSRSISSSNSSSSSSSGCGGNGASALPSSTSFSPPTLGDPSSPSFSLRTTAGHVRSHPALPAGASEAGAAAAVGGSCPPGPTRRSRALTSTSPTAAAAAAAAAVATGSPPASLLRPLRQLSPARLRRTSSVQLLSEHPTSEAVAPAAPAAAAAARRVQRGFGSSAVRKLG